MISRLLVPIVLLVAAGGCATSGAVRRVETQILVLRTEAARQDSARAAELAVVIRAQQVVLDSLSSVRDAIRNVQGDLAGEHFDIQQQLVQIQELTGQSQRRLTELRGDLDRRSLQIEQAARDTSDSTAAPMPGPTEMYLTSVAQLRRGSIGTARIGLQEFLRLYPNDTQVPNALVNLGETFAVEAPDSAAVYFREVISRFGNSDQAPTALYKLGQIAEFKGDVTAARGHYQDLLQRYPRAVPEANLARDRVAALRP